MHPDPLPILQQYLAAAQIGRIESLSGAGGWSGSLLWRVWPALQSSRATCLRRWPQQHPTPERLHLIHSVLAHIGDEGIDFVPVPLRTIADSTFVQRAGHLWELVPWLPGTADYRAHPTRPRLAAAMRALARIHEAASNWQPTRAIAPAIVERRDLARRLLSGDFDQLAGAATARHSPTLDDLARRILALAAPHLPLLLARLHDAAQVALPLQPAIRDVHHDHVLFTGDEVTGLIDFGALRIDTPLADVARLVGSLAGDDASAREFALAAYSQVRPLSLPDRELIDLLDRSDLVLSGLNWLGWLYVDRRDMGPLPPIQQRLSTIIARLNATPSPSVRGLL